MLKKNKSLNMSLRHVETNIFCFFFGAWFKKNQFIRCIKAHRDSKHPNRHTSAKGLRWRSCLVRFDLHSKTQRDVQVVILTCSGWPHTVTHKHSSEMPSGHSRLCPAVWQHVEALKWCDRILKRKTSHKGERFLSFLIKSLRISYV